MAKKSPAGLTMAQPVRYLTRMLVFVGIVGIVGAVLQKPLMQAFMSNPFLNGVILGVLLIGILHNLGQVVRLWPEVRWVNAFRRADPGSNPANLGMPNLLAPMAMLLAERIGPITLSTAATRSILDSVDSRLEESRDISRYLVGLMVFLGLLGTFWGLMITVGSVGDVVKSLDSGADPNAAFDELRHGIQAPLAGMGTAFSSSLFGLAGSLILGFLDLSATQAQNRFYNKLEEWLSTVTRLGAATPAEGEGGVPRYVGALLEQTAESLDELQRTLIRSEDRRSAVEQAVLQLSQRLTTLSDQMQTETKLMLRLAEGQLEIKPLLERLARVLEAGKDSDTATTHLRNIDVSLRRLVEEATEGRLQLVSEIRNELKLLSKTVAAVSDGRR